MVSAILTGVFDLAPTKLYKVGTMQDIAAASVLAKTHRDEYMERLAGDFPEYGWERNKGYPTRELVIRIPLFSPSIRIIFFIY